MIYFQTQTTSLFIVLWEKKGTLVQLKLYVRCCLSWAFIGVYLLNNFILILFEAARPTGRVTSTPASNSVASATRQVGSGAGMNSSGKLHEAKIEDLNSQVMEMKLTLEGMEKERDFYFGKLRDIELLCQDVTQEDNPIIQKILAKLYATEDGFAAPDDAEGVPPPEEEY